MTAIHSLVVQEIEYCRVFVHTKYDPESRISPFDIALIQLKEHSTKKPIKLGTAKSGRVTAVGWGLNERGFRAPVARELHLIVVGLTQCRLVGINEYNSLLASQMCAEADNGDICKGVAMKIYRRKLMVVHSVSRIYANMHWVLSILH